MRLLTTILAVLTCTLCQGQSLTFTQFSLEDYVSNHLVEPGALVSNVSFHGHTDQIGYASGMQDIGFNWPWEEAVVLSCSWAEISVNEFFDPPLYIDAYTDPAFEGPMTAGDGPLYDDLLSLSNECLDLLSAVNEEGEPIFNSTIFDVAAIEFDIIPTNDTLTFRYNIGGLEFHRSMACYPTPYGYSYASCEYNDIFGIFLSGPDIDGEYENNSVNVAHIPNSDPVLPFCTTAINDSTNTQLFVPYCELVPDTDLFGFCDIELGFGIFTPLIEHHVPVTCGQTYHVKFAIGDVFDHIYSSYAFLGEIGGTGNAGYNPTVNFSYQPLSEPITEIYEQCAPVWLNVIRAENSDLSVPDSILMFQQGVAVELLDYGEIPDTLIIPPMESSVSMQIDVVDDGLIEGPESLVLSVLPASYDEFSCASFANVSILDSPDPLEAFGEAVVMCDSIEATLAPEVTGGFGWYSYEWSTGGTDEEVTILNPDLDAEYYVVVSDTCGMEPDTAWFTLEPVVPITANIPIDSIAYGCDTWIPISVEVEGGYGQLQYLWQPFGANAPDIEYNSAFGPGTITVVVQDQCGITATDSIEIYSLEGDVFSYAGPSSVAGGCQGLATLNANVVGGYEPILYTWATPLGLQFGETIEVPFDGEASVTLVATDGCGQLVLETLTITDDLDPMLSTFPDSLSGICADEFDVNPAFSGGHGPFDFNWNIDGLWASSDSVLQGVSFGADALIELTINDACDQVATFELPFVLESTPIVLNPVDDLEGGCFQLVDLLAIASGGDGELSYLWTSGETVLGDGSLILFNLDPGIDSIQLVISDECGQQLEQTINVTYTGSDLDVDLGVDFSTSCSEEFVIIPTITGAEGLVNYQWLVNGVEVGTEETLVTSLFEGAVIELIASDECAFEVSDQVEVTVNQENIVTDELLVSLCIPDSMEVTVLAEGGIGELSYLWPFGIGDSSEVLYLDAPGVITVLVSDICGNQSPAPIVVEFFEPEIDILAYNMGPGIWEFTVSDTCMTCEYSWDMGDGNEASGHWINHVYDDALPHLVSLSYVNELGCPVETSILIESEVSIFVPNGFTPNDDGVNDGFAPVVFGLSEYQLQIYNRWGELVFESKDPGQFWTGNHSFGDYYVPDGVYVYLLRGLDSSALPVERSGSITLIR